MLKDKTKIDENLELKGINNILNDLSKNVMLVPTEEYHRMLLIAQRQEFKIQELNAEIEKLLTEKEIFLNKLKDYVQPLYVEIYGKKI